MLVAGVPMPISEKGESDRPLMELSDSLSLEDTGMTARNSATSFAQMGARPASVSADRSGGWLINGHSDGGSLRGRSPTPARWAGSLICLRLQWSQRTCEHCGHAGMAATVMP